jgi:hypothetical protein
MSAMLSPRWIVLPVILTTAAFAQLDNASIQGTVIDSSGAVIVGAAVSVQNQGTSATTSVHSDSNGNFIAPVLPVGSYTVTVSANGFKTSVRKDIALRSADRTRLEIALEPGEVSERVTVMGEAPLVDTASTTLGGVVGTQQLTELPANGRSLTSFLGLVPGVVMLAGGNGRSMNGAGITRLFESGTRFLVDGGESGQIDSDLPDSAYASQARVTRASVDAVSEIRIQTSAFSAEYGEALGGVVNFITKSGTNQFHGNLFEYFRNEKLDSRNYFNVAPQVKPPFRLNQFGGTIGGPIIKDRLFFFANYEGVQQRLGINQNTFVPTAAFRATLAPALQDAVNRLPLPNGPVSATEPRLATFNQGYSNSLTENTFSIKTDYTITAKDRLSVRYNYNSSFTKSWYGIADDQFRPVDSLLQLGKVTYTRTISPSLLNEAGFALNRLRTDPRAGATDSVLNFPQVTVPGMASIGPTTNDLLVSNESRTGLETLTWIKGRQQLKFGFQIVHNHARKAAEYQRTLTFNNLNEFAANNPFSAATRGMARIGLNNSHNHFFVQDDIQVDRRLSVNVGVRYQLDTPPNEDFHRIANFNPATGNLTDPNAEFFHASKLNFAPRIGFAYTPFASGKTVIRTGFGIFHSAINPAMAQISGLPSISLAAIAVRPGVGLPFPNVNPLTAGLSMFAVPLNYRTSYTENWNFNIQQAVGQNTLLQVGYVANRGLHISPYQEIDRINPLTGTRPYAPKFSSINEFFNGGVSNYNSLQATFRRRLSHGLTFNVNYTWSHSLDSGINSSVQDDSNFRSDYGNAEYDVRHVLQFDYSYQIPTVPVIPKVLGSGWQINGISVMRSGLPYSVTCGCDSVGVGRTSSRADVVPGVNAIPANFDLPFHQLDIAAFKAPATGKFGNLGRDTFHGPSAFNWDLSLFKNFKLWEAQTVQFRAEAFNMFNTPQFSNPAAALSSPSTFGRTLSTIGAVGGFGSNRQVQFALRYSF